MRWLRAQDGMTLPEVLVAATAGFVVLAATLGLLQSTLTLSHDAMQKTDALQRGRLAVDRVQQQLRSQVCLNLTTPAILPGATADSVTFYSDYGSGDPNGIPDRRTLRFDPARTSIVETMVPGVRATDGTVSHTGTPLQNLVLENAVRQTKKVGTVTTDVPFFRYYAFERAGNPPRLAATEELPVPLGAAAAARVARIDVAFAVRPTNTASGEHATNVEDRVSVRHADPNLTVPDPMCV